MILKILILIGSSIGTIKLYNWELMHFAVNFLKCVDLAWVEVPQVQYPVTIACNPTTKCLLHSTHRNWIWYLMELKNTKFISISFNLSLIEVYQLKKEERRPLPYWTEAQIFILTRPYWNPLKPITLAKIVYYLVQPEWLLNLNQKTK